MYFILAGIPDSNNLFRATGGELFERLFERGKFTEKDAIQIMSSVLRGLEYLHQKNIVHRGKNVI